MTAKVENISFSLQETCSDKNDEIIVSYEDLVKEVDLMEMNSIIGMDDYIAKPVSKDKIEEILKLWLSNKLV